MRFDLSGEERALPESLLPVSCGSMRVGNRKVMSAVLYVPRTGTLWQDLRERHGVILAH